MKKIRIGNSFDIHQRKADRKLILGGVLISETNGLDGHSDADVLTHVIIESLLGAMGEKDLGHHFSDKDEKFKNISSIKLLEYTLELLKSKEYEISNIDTQLILDTPMINKHLDNIKQNLINILNVDQDCLNIKATRSEQSITSIKNNQAVFAMASALIIKG